MEKINNKIKTIGMIMLLLSMVFIIPYQNSQVYAGDDSSSNADSEEKQETVTKEDAASTCGITPPVNTKDSLIMSVVSLCIPGVLEKVQELRNSKCREVVCEYNSIKNSIDSTYCSKQEAYYTCEFIVGEMFAIPPMSILDDLRQKVADIIANPTAYVYSYAINYIRNDLLASCGDCDSLIYAVPALLLAATDIAAVAETLTALSENGFWPDSQDNYCDELEGIVEEMELIVASE